MCGLQAHCIRIQSEKLRKDRNHTGPHKLQDIVNNSCKAAVFTLMLEQGRYLGKKRGVKWRKCGTAGAENP